MAALTSSRTAAPPSSQGESHGAGVPAHNPWAIALTVTMATFMELLDTSISNVSLPHIAGGLGTSYDESTWVLTSYLVANAVDPADERVAQPRLRPQALLHDVRRAVHRDLVSLRNRAEPRRADFFPRAAGHRRRRPGAGRTGDTGRYLSRREARRRFRALQHGDRHCARHRAAAGRMDHRQFLVALGFLHQYSDRAHLAAAVEPAGPRSGRVHRRNAARHGEAASCGSTTSASR